MIRNCVCKKTAEDCLIPMHEAEDKPSLGAKEKESETFPTAEEKLSNGDLWWELNKMLCDERSAELICQLLSDTIQPDEQKLLVSTSEIYNSNISKKANIGLFLNWKIKSEYHLYSDACSIVQVGTSKKVKSGHLYGFIKQTKKIIYCFWCDL